MAEKIVRTIINKVTSVTMRKNDEVYTNEYSGALTIRECKQRAEADFAEFISCSVLKTEGKYEMDIDEFLKYATPVK